MLPFLKKKKKSPTIDNKKLPQHVAIIMDGNGRWAAKRKLPKKAGHKAGAKTLEDISNAAVAIGIKHLTVYAFSTENWKRSEEEVKGIMDLLRYYLQNFIDKVEKDNVRIHVIGDITRLDEDIQEKIKNLENLSRHKTGMELHIALNYGGRDEILRTARKLCQMAADGEIKPEDVDSSLFESCLDTAGIPDPELMIRTSGEERISNFLLWQLAYTEFQFTNKLWPDYTVEDFQDALFQYQHRERRFGGR